MKPGQKPSQVDGFEIQVDYQKRMISSAQGQEKVILMEAIEAVDSAALRYFIKQPDVKFLRNLKEDGSEEAFVQSKLTAIGE